MKKKVLSLVVFLTGTAFCMEKFNSNEEGSLKITKLNMHHIHSLSGEKKETWQKLSCIGSASQLFERQQKYVQDLSAIGTPKESENPLFHKNKIARYRKFLGLFDTTTNFRQDKEHDRVKTTGALLEELLGLYYYYSNNNPERKIIADRCKNMIMQEKSCYYKIFYYANGCTNFQCAHNLIKELQSIENSDEHGDIKKQLYRTIIIKLLENSKFFFKRSNQLVPLDMGDELAHIQSKSLAYINKIVKIIKDIKHTIQESPLYKGIDELLHTAQKKQKEASRNLDAAITLKKDYDSSISKTDVIQQKKIKKKEREKLEKDIAALIDDEREKLLQILSQEKKYKNERVQIEGKIEKLHSLLKKKKYKNQKEIVVSAELSKVKQKIIKQLRKTSQNYIEITKLYLKIFRGNPLLTFINRAEKSLDTISSVIQILQELTGIFESPSEVGILWKQVHEAREIFHSSNDNETICFLLENAEALKKEDIADLKMSQWMM